MNKYFNNSKEPSVEKEFKILYETLFHYSRTNLLYNEIFASKFNVTDIFVIKNGDKITKKMLIEIFQFIKMDFATCTRRFLEFIIKDKKYNFLFVSRLRKKLNILDANGILNKESKSYKVISELKKSLEYFYIHYRAVDFSEKEITENKLNSSYNFFASKILNIRMYEFIFFEKENNENTQIEFDFLELEKFLFGDYYKNNFKHKITSDEIIIDLIK